MLGKHHPDPRQKPAGRPGLPYVVQQGSRQELRFRIPLLHQVKGHIKTVVLIGAVHRQETRRQGLSSSERRQERRHLVHINRLHRCPEPTGELQDAVPNPRPGQGKSIRKRKRCSGVTSQPTISRPIDGKKKRTKIRI